MKPRRTVLDGELSSMGGRVERGETALAARPLEAVSVFLRAGPAPLPSPAPNFVTVKLLTDAGAESTVGNWVSVHTGSVVSSGPQVLLCRLPVGELRALDSCTGLNRAEAARHLLPRLVDARGPATGLDAALNTHALTGQGVVIGIVDTGVDWRHDDFRNDDGSTRLELFGYANRPQGSSVSTFDEFDAADLNAALNGQGPVPQGDPHGHGTHCASIAAGNGRASARRFRGVARGAALIGVRSEPLLDTHTIWGIRRIFELAGPRPAVITLSLGGHLGPHDGTTALENVIARESGRGRIVVAAAGNEGADAIHWRGEMQVGTDLAIPVRIGDSDLQFVDVWVPRGDDVNVEIETPDGARFAADGTVNSTVFGTFLADWREDPVNRDQNLTLFVQNGRVNFTWRIRLTPQQVTHGEVHAWAGTVNPSTSAQLFPGTTDNGFSIGMPATEERAIAVGSFVSRNAVQAGANPIPTTGLSVGQLSPFSSLGPARLGYQKPDIAAPGQFVTAALAANSLLAIDPRFTPRHDPIGRYITIQGTSMATPFVAGVIALMLEREPALTPEEIQQRMRITARRDAWTGRVWHSGFGFGKIDVEALLSYRA